MIFRWPPIDWNLASACYAVAYTVGCVVFALMAKHRRLFTEGIGYVAVVGLVGGLVGANVGQLLATNGGAGKSVLGGVIGGYIAVAIAKRLLGLRRPTGDLFAVALMAGEVIGRFGCYFGGCCYGKPYLGWGAVLQHGAYRYPTQLYLSALCAVILLVLLAVERWVRPAENGLWLLQGALYCVGRFVVEFYRDGAALHIGLTTAQWTCIVGFLFFTGRIFRERPFAQHRRRV